MLSSAILAARDDELEYVQIVSFGCGHDAYLVRRDHPADAGDFRQDASGSKAGRERYSGTPADPGALLCGDRVHARRSREEELQRPVPWPDPYPVKFKKADQERDGWCWCPTPPTPSAGSCPRPLRSQGIRTESLAVGREEAIRLRQTVCAQRHLLPGPDGHRGGAGRPEERQIRPGPCGRRPWPNTSATAG